MSARAFVCPKCKRTVTFPLPMKQVWHKCQPLALRQTELVPQESAR